MDLYQFEACTADSSPPQDLPPVLQALWFEARGDWDRAHRLVQDLSDASAAWVHAYLHRKEGDIWNADYWYANAGRSRPSVGLEREWRDIATALLRDRYG